MAGMGNEAIAGDAGSVRIALLADHLELIAAVGRMRWREWGDPPDPEDPVWWVDVTRREAGRERLPVT